MPRTLEQGRLFAHTIRLQKTSARHHRAWTHEIEPPFRESLSHVFRVFGERGIVVGWWHVTDRAEDTALLKALDGLRRPELDGEVVTWQRPGAATNSTSMP